MGIVRKLEGDTTTIQMYWVDKDNFSRFRLKVGRYKNTHGDHYESDKNVMKRFMKIILELTEAKKIEKYADRLQKFEEILKELNQPNNDPLSTLPWKTQNKPK